MGTRETQKVAATPLLVVVKATPSRASRTMKMVTASTAFHERRMGNGCCAPAVTVVPADGAKAVGSVAGWLVVICVLRFREVGGRRETPGRAGGRNGAAPPVTPVATNTDQAACQSAHSGRLPRPGRAPLR